MPCVLIRRSNHGTPGGPDGGHTQHGFLSPVDFEVNTFAKFFSPAATTGAAGHTEGAHRRGQQPAVGKRAQGGEPVGSGGD